MKLGASAVLLNFVVVFVDVAPHGNDQSFGKNIFVAPVQKSLEPVILFHNAKSALTLDGAVAAQKNSHR